MVLSTEDHQELMKNIADKKTAHFSLIPSVPSSQTTGDDTSQAGEIDSSANSQKIENSDKIKGGLARSYTLFCLMAILTWSICQLYHFIAILAIQRRTQQ